MPTTTSIHPIKRFFFSLKFKLSFYVGFVVFLAIVAFAYHSVSLQEEHLVNARVQEALKDSEVIKAAIWNGMMTKDRAVIREIVKAIGQQEGFKEINIYDRKGLLHYSSGGSGERPPDKDNPLLTDIESNASVRYKFLEDGNLLAVVNPLVNTRSCATAGCHAHPQSQAVLGALELKLPLKDLRAQILNNAYKTYIFGFLLFLLVSSILGLGVIFLVSRRMRKLEEKARKIAAGKYQPVETIKGRDSIAVLSRAIDAMSKQISERTGQLEESRTMYKELFEKVPCYISVISRDYRIVRANQTFTNDFGDQVGRHCYTVRKGQDSRCENCQVEKTFTDGLSHRSEEIWNPGGGDKKTYLVIHSSPIFDNYGHVAEVMEMSIDVTRMVTLQLKLERKETEYRNLIDNIPCYLTVIDESFNVVFYNKMFARDFGRSWGQKCYKVYKGRDSKCDNCPAEKTFADGDNHSSEEVWLRNGQEVYLVTYTSPVLDENGEIVAVMEMSPDVTEVKLLQNQLAALGETIAGMSHAVKNILSGLEGGVYMVDSGLKQGKDDRIRYGWDMVKRNVARVSDLVKNILYASKEREPEYEECDPRDVLMEIHNLYEERARAYGIELIQDFDLNVGACLIDSKGIHSAVSNLVANAIEACRAAPEIKRYQITLSGKIDDSMILIRVSDNGPGISEEIRRSLFKKFFSTKGSKGTGLGLVVTRKVIEEHKGTISVDSEPGKGATFSISIPCRTLEEKHQQEVSEHVSYER
jgi:histidine kinase